MARWQQLYEMLLEKDLSPHEIVSRLNVRPSRLRALLAGKRLMARLDVAEAVANRQAGHAVVSSVASAVRGLTALVESEKDETARKSCLDVIQTAGRVYQRGVQSQQAPRPRPPWASTPADDGEADDEPAEDLPAAPALAGNPADFSGPPPAGGESTPQAAGHSAAEDGPVPASAETPPGRSRPPARRTGASLEAVLADARRRREFRQEIIRHGGERIARRIQFGR